MELRIDALFSHDPELPHDEPHDLETALLALAPADAPHPEDAFLADFARWLCARGCSAAQRRAALELAREALDHAGGPDGPWQALPVETLAGGGDGCAARPDIERVRELVSWLGDSARISLHGQRLLARRLSAVRGAQPGAAGAPASAPLAA